MENTFREAWKEARRFGPRFAMVVAWNEFSLREGKSAELSKDIEPSKEHGDKYLKLLKEEIARFKSGEPPEQAPTARWLGVEGVVFHFARPGRARTGK